MPTRRKTIFANAIKARMKQENRTAENIIQEYTELTDAEKKEILAAINS